MFKPMLASPPDFSQLRWPLAVSEKLDGVRATTHQGSDGRTRLYSRSMKLIPNQGIQALASVLPPGLDGELICGAENERDHTYRRTVSAVMRQEGSGEDVRFFVFDRWDLAEPFFQRQGRLRQQFETGLPGWLVHHQSRGVISEAHLEEREGLALEAGFEGLMLRCPYGRYKFGRATAKGQELLKLKRWEDAEMRVTRWEELLHNGNPEFRNELGHAARTTHQEGKVPMGTLGALFGEVLNGKFAGQEVGVGTGFSAQERAVLWMEARAGTLLGQVHGFKYFPLGGKDKPRHPVWRGRRAEVDQAEGMGGRVSC